METSSISRTMATISSSSTPSTSTETPNTTTTITTTTVTDSPTEAATTAPLLSTSTSAAATTNNTQPVQLMDPAVIASIAIGAGVAVFAIIIVVVVCLVRRHRRKKQKGPPPMMPDPYPTVNIEAHIGQTSSTVDLVRNDSLEYTGTSADALPIAPLPPSSVVDYEPPDPIGGEEVYVNQGPNEGQDDLPEDYEKPIEWGGAPTSDDLYIPMTIPKAHNSRDFDKPVPSSQLVSDYADPNKARPPQCGGSVNKGYVNVPNSQPAVGTLPKYANMQKTDEKPGLEEDQEDYENIPKSVLEAKSGGHGNHSETVRQKMMELSAEAAQRKATAPNRPSPKQKQKLKSNCATSPKSTDTSTSSSPTSTPTTKHKTWTKPSSNGEGVPDYVNVKEYTKHKPKAKGHLDFVSFNKKSE